MLTLKACGSGWMPARDAYNGLANFPVSQTVVREHFCNYCATRISTVYHADVCPSRALTMVPNPLAVENLGTEHGRGIHLMKLAMDEVSFQRGGTEIHIRKQLGNEQKTTGQDNIDS